MAKISRGEMLGIIVVVIMVSIIVLAMIDSAIDSYKCRDRGGVPIRDATHRVVCIAPGVLK